jgi:hypothetical protein
VTWAGFSPATAWLWPLAIDLSIAQSTLALLALSGTPRRGSAGNGGGFGELPRAAQALELRALVLRHNVVSNRRNYRDGGHAVNTLHVATWLAAASAVVSFAVGVYTAWYASKDRRRVSVLVHHGFFMGQAPPSPSFYFMKVTNLSRHRDIEIMN